MAAPDEQLEAVAIRWVAAAAVNSDVKVWKVAQCLVETIVKETAVGTAERLICQTVVRCGLEIVVTEFAAEALPDATTLIVGLE